MMDGVGGTGEVALRPDLGKKWSFGSVPVGQKGKEQGKGSKGKEGGVAPA